MKPNITLKITSLLAILLFSVHFADDIARGIEKGDLFDYTGVLLIAGWLAATLMFAERRWGLAIVLFFSIAAGGVPLLHMTGAGMAGGRIANSSGVLLWAWTLIALGATGIVSAMLAARDLWMSMRRAA
jgi:hypothetical protein